MLDKILIIDFEDSFTHNIANVLYPFVNSVRVIPHNDFFANAFESLIKSNSRHGLILGPGPGHPDDYKEYFNFITKLMEKSNIYILGICLGHQIIGRIKGFDVRKSNVQIHGQQEKIKFENNEYLVQRYNSLSVYEGLEERVILTFNNGISYQFHPESIGTHDKHIFFQKLIHFVCEN